MDPQANTLALAAGGARGAYQAGALLYLAEQRVRFVAVAGTSIGVLNAAYYAQGDGSAGHVEGLCQHWRALPELGVIRLNRATALTYLTSLLGCGTTGLTAPLGLVSGELSILDPRPVEALLDCWVDHPRACASLIDLNLAVLSEINPLVDILTGCWRGVTYLNARQLGPTKLRQALLAASAIPLAFPSRAVDGEPFADAALADPLPARFLFKSGARRIVSVFLSDDPIQDRADYPGSIVFQIRPSAALKAGLASVFDFSRTAIEVLIDLGYRDARTSYGQARDLFEHAVQLQVQGDALCKLADSLPERGARTS